VLIAQLALGGLLADPGVAYANTLPGRWGVAAALLVEAAISFRLVLVVLSVSQVPAGDDRQVRRYTSGRFDSPDREERVTCRQMRRVRPGRT
jgi:hypothetical protein